MNELTPLTHLKCGVRARKLFQKLNIRTIGELISNSEIDLLRHPAIGISTIGKIQQALGKHGLALAGSKVSLSLKKGRAGRPKVIGGERFNFFPGEELERQMAKFIARYPHLTRSVILREGAKRLMASGILPDELAARGETLQQPFQPPEDTSEKVASIRGEWTAVAEIIDAEEHRMESIPETFTNEREALTILSRALQWICGRSGWKARLSFCEAAVTNGQDG